MTITLTIGLAILLLVAPATGEPGTSPEIAPSIAFPAWTEAFSRLPDDPIDERGRSNQWRDDPALARIFSLADETTSTGPDWTGLARDTAFLFGYQAVAIGIIFLLPEDVSQWSDKAKHDAGSQWIQMCSIPPLTRTGR